MSAELANIILYSLIIVCDLIGLCATVVLFSLMLLRRAVIKTDRVSYLLIANSYIAFIIASPLFIEMSLNSIYGQLHPESSFDGGMCRFKSYAIYITGCVYFQSFLLQSIYRFCRIVHPTRPVFQSFYRYVILSVTQWVLAALTLLLSLFLGDIEYLPKDYHCQFAPTNLRGSLIGLSFLFLIPFISTLVCYFYTLHYVRTKTAALTTINQYTSVRRDLIILSRLLILFTFIIAVALPHVLIPIFYTITGSIAPWVVSFEWFLTFFSLAVANILQIVVLPHLKKIWTRPVRVQPFTTVRQTAQ